MILRLLTLVAALLPGVAAAQSTALTALDRDYEARGWEAVGRLDTGSGFCSATLIAPDLVLSAAHCVYGSAGQLLKAESITFRAGYRHGVAAATRSVARFVAHPGYVPNGTFNTRNIANDVALLKLAEPIPSHEINAFALHGDAVEAGAVSVVSYGQGRADLQSRQRRCQLLQQQRGVLMFDCDVTFGSSGAPVFSHLNGRGRILSVISGMARLSNGKQVSVGPQLPALVAELKRELRAQVRGPEARIRRLGVGRNGAAGAKFVRVD